MTTASTAVTIDAAQEQYHHYRALNEAIHAAVEDGATDITIANVRGQRYIGAGLGKGVTLTLEGVPGNDLAAFMNGADIIVHANGQEGVANTMNDGRIVIHGDCGDIPGHSMRGGRIYVRGGVGYRAGIHMKAFGDRFPVLVCGRAAQDYLGEYMAGGILAVLNLDDLEVSPVTEYVGTGMHGGTIYVRGKVEDWQLGAEVGHDTMSDADWEYLLGIINDYAAVFDLDLSHIRRADFVKLTPKTSRPYGTLYAY